MSTLRVVSVLFSTITTATTVLNGSHTRTHTVRVRTTDEPDTTVLNRFGIPSAYDVTQGLLLSTRTDRYGIHTHIRKQVMKIISPEKQLI